MSDPDERLSSFDPGPAMNPLPPSDVRRQGDRLRRRNTVLAGVGGALAVALIATPIALLGARDDGDAAPDPAPPAPSPSVTTDDDSAESVLLTVPDNFPLGDGMPADTVVSDERPYGEIVMATVNVCDSEVWSAKGAQDLLGAVWSNGVVGGQQRTLAVYADAAEAESAVRAFDDAIGGGCSFGNETSSTEATQLNSEGTLGWVETYVREGEPNGARVGQLTLVGNALLIDHTFVAEPTTAVTEQTASDLANRASGVIEAMCVFSTLGCGGVEDGPGDPSSPEIPDDFPLLSGWPSDDAAEPGADYGRQGPSRSLEGFDYLACGAEAPALAAGDFLRASFTNVEDYRSRQLFTFADADAATAEIDRFVDHFMSCPQESSSPESVLYTEQRPVTLGGQSTAIVRIQGTPDGPAIGLEVLVVVRVGLSVVIDTAYNEGIGTERNIRAQINRQGSDLAEVISAMCLFTEAGCG